MITLNSQNCILSFSDSGEFQGRGERLDPPGVAALAEHVIVQGVTAPALLLTTQQHAAVNTPDIIKIIIVKPWSKSESKPLSKQAPKLNKSPPKKEKRRIWTLG